MDIFSGDGEYDYNPQIDEVDEEVDYDEIENNEYKDDDKDDEIGCLPVIMAIIVIGGLVGICL